MPKLLCALDRCSGGTALFQELFPSWLKDFTPPICPTWSYLKQPQRPRTSQHTLQIRSWRRYPSYPMLWTGAEWHCTLPGAIPQLADGFWTPKFPDLELLMWCWNGLRRARMAWDGFKFAPRCPKTVQDRPETVHHRPKMASGWPRDDPKLPKMTQASPRMAPG